jgi:hypothetical protein
MGGDGFRDAVRNAAPEIAEDRKQELSGIVTRCI